MTPGSPGQLPLVTPQLTNSPFETPRTAPRTGSDCPNGTIASGTLDVIVLGKQSEDILASLGAGMPMLVLRSS